MGYPVGFESLCPLRCPSTLLAFVVNIFGVDKEGRLKTGGAVGWVRDIGDPHHGPAGGRGGDYQCGVVGWDGGMFNGGSLQELCLKLVHAPGGYSAVGQPCDQIHRHVQAAEDAFIRPVTGETKDTEGMSQMASPPHEDDGGHRRRDRESSPAEVLDSGGTGIPGLSLALAFDDASQLRGMGSGVSCTVNAEVTRGPRDDTSSTFESIHTKHPASH